MLAKYGNKDDPGVIASELKGYVERQVEDGRYENPGEVVHAALRRMEASELAEELKNFESAFAGANERPETEEDIRRVEEAVKAGRKR